MNDISIGAVLERSKLWIQCGMWVVSGVSVSASEYCKPLHREQPVISAALAATGSPEQLPDRADHFSTYRAIKHRDMAVSREGVMSSAVLLHVRGELRQLRR